MAEYIDKNKIIDYLKNEFNWETTGDKIDVLCDIINFKKEDVVQLLRAKWQIEEDDSGWIKHVCTNCGYEKRTDVHVSLDWKYCPMCGAKMEG